MRFYSGVFLLFIATQAVGEPTATDKALAEIVGEPVPDSIPPWLDEPPQLREGGPAETVAAQGQIRNVTDSSIVVYKAD